MHAAGAPITSAEGFGQWRRDKPNAKERHRNASASMSTSTSSTVSVAGVGANVTRDEAREHEGRGQVLAAEGTPPRDPSLRALHDRSAPLQLAAADLSRSLDSGRRLDALDWLVQAFDAMNFPDAQLFAAFGLLDRFAANAAAPIDAGPEAFALVLAVMLVVIKAWGVQDDFDRAKTLVVEVLDIPTPWLAVWRAEAAVLQRLDFRVCTPTAWDFLERLVADAAAGTPARGLRDWDTERFNRCSTLSAFLLEVAVVSEPVAFYGSRRPPLAAALAALLLALFALGIPRQSAAALTEPLHILGSPGALVTELVEAMRRRWLFEDQIAADECSTIMAKYLRRAGQFGVSPPVGGELYLITGGFPGLAWKERGAEALPTLGVDVPVVGTGAAATALPQGVVQQQVHAPQPSREPAPDLPLPASAQQPKANSSGREGAVAPREPRAEEVHTPHLQERRKKDERLPPPERQHPERQRRQRRAERRASDPLVDAVQVLNLVMAQPLQERARGRNQSCGGSAAKAGVSIARAKRCATLRSLLSSALSVEWPDVLRSVGSADAATRCRNTAATLQDLAAQLLGAASALEGGSTVEETDSKRRCTRSGPAALREPSLLAAGAAALGASAARPRFQ
mmetsp:Transcript_110183/g.310736  ORF Transcript_110183/g.310736 Transcript_110183/m.310736 type:complete len:626 (+) Transcript_110183:126-2003(+)